VGNRSAPNSCGKDAHIIVDVALLHEADSLDNALAPRLDEPHRFYDAQTLRILDALTPTIDSCGDSTAEYEREEARLVLPSTSSLLRRLSLHLTSNHPTESEISDDYEQHEEQYRDEQHSSHHAGAATDIHHFVHSKDISVPLRPQRVSLCRYSHVPMR